MVVSAKLPWTGQTVPSQEPSPFNPKWFSHKFKGAGVRYEVGVCIQTGWIVWVNGPFLCGRYPDLPIAREKVVNKLLPGAMILAGGGYRDGRVYMETPTGLNNPDQRMKKVARARHETVNCRFKVFAILQKHYSNNLDTHSIVFHSIAVITKLAIVSREKLFEVMYKDN